MARSSVNISRIVRFFFYFSCLCFFIRSLPPLVATVHASPVSVVGRQPFDFNSPAWQAILEKVNLRPGEIVIGWRYVSSFKARDYDKFGTLTAIRASRTSIGEGAYFSPDPQAEFKQDVLYLIIGIEQKVKEIPKLFIQDDAEPPHLINNHLADLKQYITSHGKDPKVTMLFSEHYQFRGTYQGLLPPTYLVKSAMLNENYRLKEHGKNTLGIRLVRLSPNDIPNMKEIDLSKSGLPIAKWEEWGIPGWPAGKPASEFSRKE